MPTDGTSATVLVGRSRSVMGHHGALICRVTGLLVPVTDWPPQLLGNPDGASSAPFGQGRASPVNKMSLPTKPVGLSAANQKQNTVFS
jgi:hypothetical protein